MKKRLLGSLKTPILAIGLGCMGMSEFYGATNDAEVHCTMVMAREPEADMLAMCGQHQALLSWMRSSRLMRLRVGATPRLGWWGLSERSD